MIRLSCRSSISGTVNSYLQYLFSRLLTLSFLLLLNKPHPSHPKWILVEVWGLPLHHLYRHDPKRPDVDLWTILLPCDDLRRHPVRCSDHRGALVLLRSDLSTEAKVGCVGGGREEGKEGRRRGRRMRGEETERRRRGGKEGRGRRGKERRG